jgi:site-specific recombinase XerD
MADIANGNLDVRRLKGSLHTVQPLESHLNPLLDEKLAVKTWLAERGEHPSMFLFTSRAGSRISRQQGFRLFQAVAAKAGLSLELRHPHVLKHSICQHLVDSGVNLPYIRQQVGHSDPKNTMRYLEIHDRQASQVTATALAAVYV